MPEVLEVVTKLVMLAGLFYFSWQDCKTNMLGVIPLVFFAGMGMSIQLMSGGFSLSRFLTQTVVGIACLIISIVTSESLGVGDGLLFLGTGMFLDLKSNFVLFCGALLLAGGFSGICLLLKKKSGKDKIPMAPFVLGAYVIFLL